MIGNAASMIPILQRRINEVEGSNDHYLFGDDWTDHDLLELGEVREQVERWLNRN